MRELLELLAARNLVDFFEKIKILYFVCLCRLLLPQPRSHLLIDLVHELSAFTVEMLHEEVDWKEV